MASIFEGMIGVQGEYLSPKVLREEAIKAADEKAVTLDRDAEILLVWWNNECRAFQMAVSACA